MTLPTLHLTERRPTLCRLAPAEVEFLLGRHRTAFEVLPTARRHVYRVRPAGVAGLVVTPRRRIVVSSKVPLANLFFLDPLADAPPAPDAVLPDNGAGVLDFLASQLALRMAERAAAGLHRAYRETTAQGAYLVGRLDVAEQLRAGHGRKEQIHSRPDEFTHDLPCNQLPRLLAAGLLAGGLPCPAVRDRLQAALAGFAGVSAPPVTPDLLAGLQAPRLPAEYAPLIDLCRLLLDSLAPTPAGGPTPAPAFLLPLERLFERYLSRAAAEAFAGRPGWLVQAQEPFALAGSVPGRPDVQVRPDVTVRQGAGAPLVVDAKWKRLPRAAVVTDDLYQALSYCLALGARTAVLVYPGRRRRVWEYAVGPARVQVRTLDVAGTPGQCARARRRLGRALRAAV